MVYIVSGLSRSGTSMMMRCLQIGGMKAHWEPATEEATHDHDSDYHPSPHGFFQFPDEGVDAVFSDFYAGYLVKLDWRELLRLPKGNYQIVLMRRDPSEIKQSLLRTGIHEDLAAAEFYDLVFPAIEQAVDAVTIRYKDVLDHPTETFRRLQGRGWPISDAAAIGVDHSLYRHRGVK